MLKFLLGLMVALPLVVAGTIYLALDTAPKIQRAAEITPASIERAKRILDQNDPRRLRSGARRTISVSAGDVDLAANYVAQQYAAGGARVQLREGVAQVGATLKLPTTLAPIYVNLDATVREDGVLPRLDSLRVGQLPIPARVGQWLVPRVVARVLGAADTGSVLRTIKKVSIDPNGLAVTYEWQGDLSDGLRAVLLPIEERQRLRVYQDRLAAVTRSLKGRDVSLTEVLVPLFTLAAERSREDRAVAENRTAILVLALYVNGHSVGAILPEAKSWPFPLRHEVLLNRRDDSSKHFIISAALAAKAGGPLADAVGLYKEIEDSRSGSGFSFNDLAADRAGTRFGEYAADPASARTLQHRLRAGLRESDVMVATDGLPEFIPEVEFQRRFGGIDGPAYKTLMAEIERRLAALPLYR